MPRDRLGWLPKRHPQTFAAEQEQAALTEQAASAKLLPLARRSAVRGVQSPETPACPCCDRAHKENPSCFPESRPAPASHRVAQLSAMAATLNRNPKGRDGRAESPT